jgi:hypothetical protein
MNLFETFISVSERIIGMFLIRILINCLLDFDPALRMQTTVIPFFTEDKESAIVRIKTTHLDLFSLVVRNYVIF